MEPSRLFTLAIIAGVLASPSAGFAQNSSQNFCAALPGYSKLQSALRASVKPTGGPSNGGLDLNMWASIVGLDGSVCVVTFSGQSFTDQWLGSRVISAQKANTANDFSLNALALSTANLYSAVQPGGSLYGLQHSNPVDAGIAYAGPASKFGAPNDPLTGERVGGVNVFGGGLALYNASKQKIGALGVSGDTSCADHNVAWRVREALGLGAANVLAGVGGGKDKIIYDIDANGHSASGFGHPTCGNQEVSVGLAIHAVCSPDAATCP
jgi:heme-degrading protein